MAIKYLLLRLMRTERKFVIRADTLTQALSGGLIETGEGVTASEISSIEGSAIGESGPGRTWLEAGAR
jgi:hypothetical protein